jgi:hypothetical protein
VFFIPEAAPFKIAGGGNRGRQHAQFVSWQLTVTGGGILTTAPGPTAVIPPISSAATSASQPDLAVIPCKLHGG